MSSFRRPRHRTVARVLSALDAAFLESVHCYFGGGTRIAVELDEYRESEDVDFLCSDIEGYRRIRSGISQQSLGPLLRKRQSGVSLLREVRADQYGIRTAFTVDDEPVKFEIILEARIKVTGTRAGNLPVPALDHTSCFAEKWLANADRWTDASVLSRDAIDLVFMLAAWDSKEAQAGAAIAIQAYGTAIGTAATSAAAKLITDFACRRQCTERLAIEDTKALLSGLKKLQKFSATLGE